MVIARLVIQRVPGIDAVPGCSCTRQLYDNAQGWLEHPYTAAGCLTRRQAHATPTPGCHDSWLFLWLELEGMEDAVQPAVIACGFCTILQLC